MSVLRRAKLRTPDGIESIEYPLGVDAENVEVANRENLSQRLVRIDEDLEKNEEDIAAVSELAGRNRQNIGANEIRIDALERRNASIEQKPYYFNTVADMKAYQELKVGDMTVTLGYYSANDGGSGTYQIVNDSTLVDDGGSVHDITNGLKAKLMSADSAEIEKFGAHGDGVSDDTNAIKNALGSNIKNIIFATKTYLLTDEITISDKNIIGNNSTIIINNNDNNTREGMIRNSYFDESYSSDLINNINFSNIRFIVNKKRNNYLFQFKNCDVNFKNCDVIFKNTAGGAIDLYGNNHNCIIDGCSIIINSSSLTANGTCFHIRGFGGGGKSNNIKLINSYLEQNTLDETIWINGSDCCIEDVLINNCVIKDTGNSSNSMWISTDTNTIKDVIVSNNVIEKSNLTNRLITVGKKDDYSSYSISDIHCKNISIINNHINITKLATSNSYGITYSYYGSSSETECFVKNNIIKCEGSGKITAVLEGRITSCNNIINIENAEICYEHMYKIIGDVITGKCSLIRYSSICNIQNISADITGVLINDGIYPSSNFKLFNSNIKCNFLINLAGSSNGKYTIQNNEITCSESREYLIDNYGSSGTITFILINNNISTEYLLMGIASSLRAYNNYKAGIIRKGISNIQVERESYPVGTILFSGTTGKSIVRKVSQGNATSNWEEV